jgi:hypothetical protein
VPIPSGPAAEIAAALGAVHRSGERRPRHPQHRPIDFARINCAALQILPRLLQRWLPGGRIEGREYVVRNPKRHDRRPGSFKINLVTGRWADFASGERGGDPISLAAYLASCGQLVAARQLADMLGLAADG